MPRYQRPRPLYAPHNVLPFDAPAIQPAAYREPSLYARLVCALLGDDYVAAMRFLDNADQRSVDVRCAQLHFRSLNSPVYADTRPCSVQEAIDMLGLHVHVSPVLDENAPEYAELRLAVDAPAQYAAVRRVAGLYDVRLSAPRWAKITDCADCIPSMRVRLWLPQGTAEQRVMAARHPDLTGRNAPFSPTPEAAADLNFRTVLPTATSVLITIQRLASAVYADNTLRGRLHDVMQTTPVVEDERARRDLTAVLEQRHSMLLPGLVAEQVSRQAIYAYRLAQQMEEGYRAPNGWALTLLNGGFKPAGEPQGGPETQLRALPASLTAPHSENVGVAA